MRDLNRCTGAPSRSQISFADAEQAGKRKKTRREVFLGEMELVVPWKALLKVIEPHYPVAGRGRRPYPIEAMLRVHLMQNWFALSDPAMEEALYEIASLRTFAGLDLEAIPDETTILSEVVGVSIDRSLIVGNVFDWGSVETAVRGGGPSDYFSIGSRNRFRMNRPA